MINEHSSNDSEFSDDDFCTINIGTSNSDVKLHPYYTYPGIEDIFTNVHDDELEIINDNISLYLDLCKYNKSVPVKHIMMQLSTKNIDLKYFPLNTNDIKSLCGVLIENTNIESIDLSMNHLLPDACHYIGELLSVNTTILYLNLKHCNIRSAGLIKLNNGLDTNKSLKELNLSYNLIDDIGLEALSTAMINSTIERYNLSHNHLKNAKILSDVFKKDLITSIDLSWNEFKEIGLRHFFRMLYKNKSLIFLDLSWNGLSGDVLGLVLKKLITTNNTLQYLNLENNRLNSALVTMSAGFPLLKSIKTLKIGSNPLDTNEAFEILKKFGYKNKSLETLDMENICVTKEFVTLSNKIIKRRKDKNITIKHDYVIGNYEIIDVDMKEILLNRARYLAGSKKKYKKDFRKYLINLPREFQSNPTVKELEESMTNAKLGLDKVLMRQICKTFQMKRINFVDIEEMINYAVKLWPGPIVYEPKKKLKKKKKIKKSKNNQKKL